MCAKIDPLPLPDPFLDPDFQFFGVGDGALRPDYIDVKGERRRSAGRTHEPYIAVFQ